MSGRRSCRPGGLLAAGGTERYDPFYGLTNALIFDPATLTWNAVAHMAFGRWYPSLITLPNGNIVSVSGLGADNFLSVVPELFDAATETWSELPVPGPIPMYGHLVLLADGRLFYTMANTARTTVCARRSGIRRPAPPPRCPACPTRVRANQAASVLLPPAQQQRVLILGGGGFDMHSPAPALADTRIVDFTTPTPEYQPTTPMDHARMHLSAVLLPDRTVLATGGSGMEEMAHAVADHHPAIESGPRTTGLVSRLRRQRAGCPVDWTVAAIGLIHCCSARTRGP